MSLNPMVTTNTRIPLLGVGINPLDMPATLRVFETLIPEGKGHTVCVVPGHLLMDAQESPELTSILNQSSLNTPDGMAIVWALQAKGFKNTRRVYGPDLLQAACKHGLQFGWRHYFYGGSPGVADQLANRLQQQFPGLQICGTYSPPYRPLLTQEEVDFCTKLKKSRADILWVCLGSPKQEIWMYEMRERLDVPLMVGVGAAFDFLSGNKKQAPQWVQKIGMEWLFRLVQEPKRLWPRYSKYPMFLYLLVIDVLHGKSK